MGLLDACIHKKPVFLELLRHRLFFAFFQFPQTISGAWCPPTDGGNGI